MADRLDLLLEALDDEVSDEEEQNESENVEKSVEGNEEVMQEEDESENVEEIVEPNKDEDDEDLEAELAAMQAKMTEMKNKLAEKKSGKKEVKDVDLFSTPSTSSVRSSPVKTNPFEEKERMYEAKTHLKTPNFGPALPQKSSRVIQGQEKEQLLNQLNNPEKENKLKMVRNDLAVSDEEDEESHNSYGKEVNKLLKDNQHNQRHVQTEAKVGFNQIQNATLNLSKSSSNNLLPSNHMVDPYSRLKIGRPLITAKQLKVHMLDKQFVPMHKLSANLGSSLKNQDWTTIGVMYYKSSQTSKNGNSYTLWKCTDLAGAEIRTITVLLFGRCHANHYKIPLNKVVGILNAKILDDDKKGITLSVDHPDKVLEMGDSLEVGKCAAKRKDGTGCTNLVNINSCEYCAFHVKQAYKSMSSKRSELQSSFSGNVGIRARIMGKVDPKGQFFAGGKSCVSAFEPPPNKPNSAKERGKDMKKLAALGITTVDRVLMAENRDKQKMEMLNSKTKFRTHLSDAEKSAVKNVAHGVSPELGLRLLAPTPGARGLIKTLTKDARKVEDEEKLKKLETVKAARLSATDLLRAEKDKQPMLGRGISSKKGLTLDFTANKGHAKALLALKGKTIEKSSPNHVPNRKRKSEEAEKRKAKVAKVLGEKVEVEKEAEKSYVTSSGEVISKERLEAIKNKKSRNQHLIEDFDREVEEKKFNDLEKKEAMEEKMLATTELETKAVSCKICNYTAFSQSELCKQKGHRIKVITTKKRFFECGKCKNRTVALDKYPKSSCTKCGGSKWVRAGMMREKQGPKLDSESLVIRGVEQKFIGQSVDSSQMDLLN